MNSLIVANSLRFIGLVLIQVLVFKNIDFGWENFNYVNIIVYPIFIMLLPIRIPHALVVLLGFLLGITIDIFYDSLGVHASATVFMAFIRPLIIKAMEPRGGYNINHSPTKYRFGISWFLLYASILFISHLFFYFSVEAFTFVYIGQILIRSLMSFIFSMPFIIMYQYLLNPQD